MINHDSVSDVRTLLETEGLSLKKRFGQNFLTDRGIRRRLAETIDSRIDSRRDPAAEVWEIGPGIGSLTALVLERLSGPLRVFEVDHGIIRILRREFGDRIAIEEGDFVRTVRRFAAPPMAIVGNLPYYSASAMIASIVETGVAPPVMVFMVQAELADRLAAPVGTRDYSALSVLVQGYYGMDREFDVPGSAFFPRPRVGSSVVTLRRHNELPAPALTTATSAVARRAFGQRRKTLRNTLRNLVPILEELGIDPGRRPETLTPADFQAIAAAQLDRTDADDDPVNPSGD